MKVLQILVLIFFLYSFAEGQACGYTHLTIYLTDWNETPIKNAKIETFDKDFKEKYYLYPEESYSRLKRKVSWLEEKQAYFGSEGMCGGHRNIGFRFSAEGFEIFDKVIDLPLGWTSYLIKLKRNNSSDVAKDLKLTRLFTKIIDERDASIPFADLEILENSGKKYIFRSDKDGRFETDLPMGNYIIQVSKMGFRKLKIINFNIEDTKTIYLDLNLKVRGCDDCNGDILGKNNGEDRKQVVLDYQLIKRKN